MAYVSFKYRRWDKQAVCKHLNRTIRGVVECMLNNSKTSGEYVTLYFDTNENRDDAIKRKCFEHVERVYVEVIEHVHQADVSWDLGGPDELDFDRSYHEDILCYRVSVSGEIPQLPTVFDDDDE